MLLKKEADFEITDRIEVYYQASGKAKSAFERGAVGEEVLASKVVEGVCEDAALTKELDVNGEKAVVSVKKA